MNTTISSIIRRTALIFRRNYGKKVQKGCECPEPPKVEKIVEEKKCIPCSFANWKPKPRKQVECEVEQSQKPKPPMKCYPGMVIPRPKSDCKTDEIDPFKKKCCLQQPSPPEKKPPPPPPLELPIPKADWDTNC